MFARAAGFRVTSAADKELSRLQLLGGRLGGAADASAPLEGFGGSVEVLKEGHRGAIRELAKAFRVSACPHHLFEMTLSYTCSYMYPTGLL